MANQANNRFIVFTIFSNADVNGRAPPCSKRNENMQGGIPPLLKGIYFD
jgi:hypothetical protein